MRAIETPQIAGDSHVLQIGNLLDFAVADADSEHGGFVWYTQEVEELPIRRPGREADRRLRQFRPLPSLRS